MGRFWLAQVILASRKPGPGLRGENVMCRGSTAAWAEVGCKFEGGPPLPGGQLEIDAWMRVRVNRQRPRMLPP